MALLSIQLTTNGKALDFHKGTAEVPGLASDDAYYFINNILGFQKEGDEVLFMFVDGSNFRFTYDQVFDIGGVTTFNNAQNVVDAIEDLLTL